MTPTLFDVVLFVQIFPSSSGYTTRHFFPFLSFFSCTHEAGESSTIDSELIFRERFHYDRERENWILNRFTDLSLITQIHGYRFGLKSIKKLKVSLKNFDLPLPPAITAVFGSYLSSLYSYLILFSRGGHVCPYDWRGFVREKN
jgi:hypothetical protein